MGKNGKNGGKCRKRNVLHTTKRILANWLLAQLASSTSCQYFLVYIVIICCLVSVHKAARTSGIIAHLSGKSLLKFNFRKCMTAINCYVITYSPRKKCCNERRLFSSYKGTKISTLTRIPLKLLP